MNTQLRKLAGSITILALLAALAAVLVPLISKADATPTCNGLTATIWVDGSNVIHGGPGDSTTYAGTLTGTTGTDVMVGTSGDDIIDAKGGTNTVCSLGGNDDVTGGSGNDWIDASTGNNTIDAGGSTNTVTVGDGDNDITGGSGNDTVTVGSGNNIIDVAGGTNSVTTGNGNNTVTGGSGNDTVTTGSGNDYIDVAGGTNNVHSHAGHDIIIGGSGNDTFDAGDGYDFCEAAGGTNALTSCESTDHGIIIALDAQPDDAQSFGFTGSGSISTFSLVDNGGINYTTTTPSNSTYTVTEDVVSGWTLSDITCYDPTAGTSVDFGARKATITLGSHDHIVCIFTNTQDPVVDTTPPAVPTHVSPVDGSTVPSADLDKIDWSDVSDPSSPVSYYYQSSLSSATSTLDGSFITPAYTSGALSVSEIATTGTPPGTYYWHVRAKDSADNYSAWSDPWSVTVPVVPTVDITTDLNVTTDNTPTFDFTVTGVTPTTVCAIDGTATTTCASPYTTGVLADGAHVLTVVATDPYSQEAFDTEAFTVRTKGSITVMASTTPSGDTQVFSYTIDPTIGGVVADNLNPYLSGDIDAGGYAITPGTTPDGWDFDEGATTCTEGTYDALTLDANEDITCTFNYIKRANLTIVNSSAPNEGIFKVKVTGPAPHDADGTEIQFIGSGTDSSTFANIIQGAYTAMMTFVPSEWYGVQSSACESDIQGTLPTQYDTDPQSFSLSPGENIMCTFNNSEYGVITGNKFKDNNANGTDDGDPGITEWGMTLYYLADNSDTPADKTNTALNGKTAGDDIYALNTAGGGNYSFTDIVPATYLLCEDDTINSQTGWHQSYPTSTGSTCTNGTEGYQVDIGAGETKSGYNFGNWREGSIGGYKYNDLNGNGSRNSGEPKLEGWEIQLFDAGDTINPIATTITASNGKYLFEGLTPGDYVVKEVQQGGWYPVNPSTGEYALTLKSGQNKTSQHFGNAQGATVSGYKWQDDNYDGVWDGGEFGLSGVTIIATPIDEYGDTATSTDRDIKTYATDVDGSYQFAFLPTEFGDWRISETLGDFWHQTYPSLPAYFDVTITSGSVFAGASSVAEDLNFGNWEEPTVQAIKWYDLNADGSDSGENGIENWYLGLARVTATTTDTVDTELVALSLTGSGGITSFRAPEPGYYVVVEESRNGFVRTSPGVRSETLTIATSSFPSAPAFDLSSFFDIFVSDSGETISQGVATSTEFAPSELIKFGNVEYVDVGGGRFIATSGDAASTTAATPFDDINGVTVEIFDGVGTSTISIPGGTQITRTDGEPFALSDLSVGVGAIVSGLGDNVVADGVLQWGIPNIGLTFDTPITISIFVGTGHDGETLNIVRSTSSDSGWTSDGIESPATCVVSGGLCTFTATKASYYVSTHTVTSTPSSSSSSSSFGGGGPLGLLGGGGGLVLGASTSAAEEGTSGASCSGPYMITNQFLSQGSSGNDSNQVVKLQKFLNENGFGPISLTGVFGLATENAVKKFQAHYANEILAPWSITEPTGHVYFTTLRQINRLVCPGLSFSLPPLVVWDAGKTNASGVTNTESAPQMKSSDGEEMNDDSRAADSTGDQAASAGGAVKGQGFWSKIWKMIFGR